MKPVADFGLVRDREGGAFPSAHVLRRRPLGASSPFTSLRGTPHPPDQLTPVWFDGCKTHAHPAKDGGYPSPVGKGGGAGAARDGGHGRRRVPVVLGPSRPGKQTSLFIRCKWLEQRR